MEKTLLPMPSVSGTMLITLYARARETKSRNPVISYPKLAVTMALRSRRFDRYVSDADWIPGLTALQNR